MNQINQTNEINQSELWVLNDEEGKVGARKVAELAAEGANVTVGSWQAPQEFEGIFFVQPNKQDKLNKRIRLAGHAGSRSEVFITSPPIPHSPFIIPNSASPIGLKLRTQNSEPRTSLPVPLPPFYHGEEDLARQ